MSDGGLYGALENIHSELAMTRIYILKYQAIDEVFHKAGTSALNIRVREGRGQGVR